MPASSSSEPSSRRVRADRLQRAPHERGHRQPVAAPRVEVHHRRRQPVARGEPLVLGREDPVEGRDLLAALDELRVVLDERLAVRGDRDHVLEPRHRVADADLDRAEPRVEADVPPDVRVVWMQPVFSSWFTTCA